MRKARLVLVGALVVLCCALTLVPSSVTSPAWAEQSEEDYSDEAEDFSDDDSEEAQEADDSDGSDSDSDDSDDEADDESNSSQSDDSDDNSTSSTDLEYNSLDELDGKRIGVVSGGISDELIEEYVGGSYTFYYYNSTSDMLVALQSKKIDAFAADEPIATLAANRYSWLGIISEDICEDKYGYFFQKGSDTTEGFSDVITKMDASGMLDELKEKWCSADDSNKTIPDQDWDTSNGTLKMVTPGDKEPLSYVSGHQIVGYDIEVALLICKELGYGLETESENMTAMMSAVSSGKADFGGGGVSITEERLETYDFTVPNYFGALVMVVRTADFDSASSTSSNENIIDSLLSSFYNNFIKEDRWQLIVEGLMVTILISVCSGALGTLLGFATVLARRVGVRWVGRIVDGYNAIMGGIPIVVVLMVLYYVVFGSVDIDGVVVSIIAFTLSFGATSGSTMWTAVSGIDVIQEETGLALSYTRWEVFRKIIFPQARLQFTPQLIGQFVGLVKETSVVGYIAVQDLTRASDLIRSRTMEAFFPLIAVALIYFLFCRLLAWVLGIIAARLDSTKRPRRVKGVVDHESN